MGILLIDDSPAILLLLSTTLKRAGYSDVHFCNSGQAALDYLGVEVAGREPLEVDLILLDIVMPDMDGIEVCRRLRSLDTYKDTPILMVTMREEAEVLQKAFVAGANDYIVKPVRELELLARMRSALQLKQEMARRRQRELELLRVTEQLQQANAALQQLANTDPLTGIGNRRFFDATLPVEWRRARRAKGPLSLLLIDVDHLKKFNDLHGHQRGDEILSQVAAAIMEALARGGDLVTRYGGEEFAVLLPATEEAGAQAVAEEIRQAVLALALDHPDSPVSRWVTVSIGVAVFWPTMELEMKDLVAAADRALYQAKANGRNQVVSPGA